MPAGHRLDITIASDTVTMIKRHLRNLQPLLVRALANGARRVNNFRTEWNIAGNCTDPFRTEIHGAAVVRDDGHCSGRSYRFSQLLVLETPCRRCERCKGSRRTMWQARATAEVNRAMLRGCRTWFGTLTPRPEVAALWNMQAQKYQADRVGVPFDQLDEHQQFALLWRYMSREITLMIKRLRKDGHRFTYLCVSERFTGGGIYDQLGIPHAHMLIHESEVTGPIRYSALAGAWKHGFYKWKLVDSAELSGRYIAKMGKYVAKDARTRVRVSEAYGNSNDVLETEGRTQKAKF